jgi:glyoxylase-like metal-dependent hydrolase (beta-lactamase superfamily II)
MLHTNELSLIPNQGWDERILVCRNGRLVDVFSVITQRYVVLVDTVINPATAAQMVGYAQPYLDEGRQLLVVNTHADYDHCWGNGVFAGPDARWPAPILGSQRCADLIRQPEATTYLHERQEKEPAIFGNVTLIPPTLSFEGSLTIDGGDLTLELFPAPGHTEDHLAIYLPEINTLLAADAAELPFPFARTVAGLPVMRQTMAQLAALNPATVFYCHAPVTSGPQLLHDNITYFDRVEEKSRAAMAEGLPQDLDAVDLVALVDLPFEQATPAGPEWQEIDPFYRTTGHAQQIRMMLAWLASATA